MSSSDPQQPNSDWHTVTLEIPFPNASQAQIAKQTIEVDKELQPHAVKRTLEVKGDVLVANFETLTIRLARLTVNSFLENVELVVRTMGEFAEDRGAFAKEILPQS